MDRTAIMALVLVACGVLAVGRHVGTIDDVYSVWQCGATTATLNNGSDAMTLIHEDDSATERETDRDFHVAAADCHHKAVGNAVALSLAAAGAIAWEWRGRRRQARQPTEQPPPTPPE